MVKRTISGQRPIDWHNEIGIALQMAILNTLSPETISGEPHLSDFNTVEQFIFPDENYQVATLPKTANQSLLSPHQINNDIISSNNTSYCNNLNGSLDSKIEPFEVKIYGQKAFRHFFHIFNTNESKFLQSIGDPETTPLITIGNINNSSSDFWRTHDDNYLIKTLEKEEAEFLKKLLPAYYVSLHNNRNTLLPKFFGLFQLKLKSWGKPIRLVIMNNLVPTNLDIDSKFDLKGSSHGRNAIKTQSFEEYSKTLKDNDFRELFKDKASSIPEGIHLEPHHYAYLLGIGLGFF